MAAFVVARLLQLLPGRPELHQRGLHAGLWLRDGHADRGSADHQDQLLTAARNRGQLVFSA
jgi:hypothetical protein